MGEIGQVSVDLYHLLMAIRMHWSDPWLYTYVAKKIPIASGATKCQNNGLHAIQERTSGGHSSIHFRSKFRFITLTEKRRETEQPKKKSGWKFNTNDCIQYITSVSLQYYGNSVIGLKRLSACFKLNQRSLQKQLVLYTCFVL